MESGDICASEERADILWIHDAVKKQQRFAFSSQQIVDRRVPVRGSDRDDTLMVRALGEPVDLGARNVAHRDLCSLCALADITQNAGWGKTLRDEYLLGALTGA